MAKKFYDTYKFIVHGEEVSFQNMDMISNSYPTVDIYLRLKDDGSWVDSAAKIILMKDKKAYLEVKTADGVKYRLVSTSWSVVSFSRGRSEIHSSLLLSIILNLNSLYSFLFCRNLYYNLCPFINLALNIYAAAILVQNFFSNRKTKTWTSHFSCSWFIYSIESFKYSI